MWKQRYSNGSCAKTWWSNILSLWHNAQIWQLDPVKSKRENPQFPMSDISSVRLGYVIHLNCVLPISFSCSHKFVKFELHPFSWDGEQSLAHLAEQNPAVELSNPFFRFIYCLETFKCINERKTKDACRLIDLFPIITNKRHRLLSTANNWHWKKDLRSRFNCLFVCGILTDS